MANEQATNQRWERNNGRANRSDVAAVERAAGAAVAGHSRASGGVLALRSESSAGEDVQAVRRGEAPDGVPPRLPQRQAQGRLQGVRSREATAGLLGEPREAPRVVAGLLSRQRRGVSGEEPAATPRAAAASRRSGEGPRGAPALARDTSRGGARAHATPAPPISAPGSHAPGIVGAAQAGAARCGRPVRGLWEQQRGAASSGLQRSLPRGGTVPRVPYAAALRGVAARGRRAGEVSRGVWGGARGDRRQWRGRGPGHESRVTRHGRPDGRRGRRAPCRTGGGGWWRCGSRWAGSGGTGRRSGG